MKIVLFGGAFDPPHFGHQKVVTNFLQLGLCDEVWLLPVKSHAFAKNMADSESRLAMLDILRKEYFEDLPVQVCRYELDQPGMSITFQTLNDLSKKFPGHQFSFLMGSDNLANFHKWHSYHEMLEKFTFYVYPRAGYDFSLIRPGMMPLHDLEVMKVSSTEVKAKLLANEEVSELVPEKVINYLRKHHLYSV